MNNYHKQSLPKIDVCYGSYASVLRKFERFGCKNRFNGKNAKELESWQEDTRCLLQGLLGLDKMECAPLQPVQLESTMLSGGIRREHWRIRVEPDVWMTFYVLIPPGAGKSTCPVLCPPGHNGGGKYAVAGADEYEAVAEKIQHYHYDYGLQLARMGYVALCPDCRGFGERRESTEDAAALPAFLKGDCARLAHMGLPLGIPVAGMFVWDLMRLIDYVQQRGEWDKEHISCIGFSGGGMQTLLLAAVDMRITFAMTSGYFYGYRDALLTMNTNCACNYIPHLWEHLDMGDIGCLIAPRPFLIQSCEADRLNGHRGIVNVTEQVEITQKAYDLLQQPQKLLHEICDGTHQFHTENLNKNLEILLR
ncbi:MAG: alpha/beta hydrolase family protein [Oscillospiraceae bacterium]|nr:alpha/beta hydrolase family protein [Oscillospiraceae bacterium]